jgi:Uma2 family endonuclease
MSGDTSATMQRLPFRFHNERAGDASVTSRASEVIAKANDWLRFSCKVVWVVDPETKNVTVYSDPPRTLILSENDTLVCEELLPGFSLPVSQVFAR